MKRLTIRGVSRKFVSGSRINPVLDAMTFEVATGEAVALFGPNGCGKSTLFQILAGLDLGYEGELHFDGAPHRDASVGYMFQNFSGSLFPWLTLRENIAFAQQMRNGALGAPLLADSPEAILQRFGLGDFCDHYPYQVSGGMQQRVCFGRTVATQQDLLLLDEPFSALDAGGFAQIVDAFESIEAARRPPTILICHDLDQAMVFCDRVLVLSPRPAAVVEDVAVPFARPRHPDLLLDESFQKIRTRIMEVRLKTEIAGVRTAPPAREPKN
jgi:ABC-type nitrate/sulfonate/bicarbonate transport system ATPase subunit